MRKVKSIEIVFPFLVELPKGLEHVLSSLVDMVCKKYEDEHSDRVMWPAGFGNKPIWREPEEPLWDDSVYQIDVAERQAYPQEIKRRKEEAS